MMGPMSGYRRKDSSHRRRETDDLLNFTGEGLLNGKAEYNPVVLERLYADYEIIKELFSFSGM